jgi:membrane protein DedA with SNARE-associated domain
MGALPPDQPEPDPDPAGPSDDARAAAAARRPGGRPLGRRHVLLLVAPIIPMLVGTQIANALFPTLSTENPLLLITLSAPNRNLIVATHGPNAVPLALYFAIGFARLLAPDPFFYAIGWHYGETAIRWMERRTPTFGELIRQLEWLFTKAGGLLVLVMPNNYVCLLAGASGMRRSWFWTLNVIGTIGRLVLLWQVGEVLDAQIAAILSFIAEYRVPLLVLTIGLVVLTSVREWRTGTSEIRQLIDLEHELEKQAPDAVTQGSAPHADSDEETS